MKDIYSSIVSNFHKYFKNSPNITISLLFSRISDVRIEWINIIKKHQPLNEDRRLYVCDLHFTPEMIIRHVSKTILRKNAVPIFE